MRCPPHLALPILLLVAQSGDAQTEFPATIESPSEQPSLPADEDRSGLTSEPTGGSSQFWSGWAAVNPINPINPINLDQVGGGDLLWRSPRGFVPLPLVDTEITVQVSGVMAFAQVSQEFVNPTDERIEALYVFPLPPNAGVHHMEIRAGSRRIVAIVREREEARASYESARDAGQQAALVEQMRPNLFTTAVANIGPGEAVEVLLDYVEEVELEDGEFILSVPLTFTPRYRPGFLHPGDASTDEPGVPATPFVSPAAMLAPTASFLFEICPGFPISPPRSASHLLAQRRVDQCWFVEPRDGTVAADRDIVIAWRPRESLETRSAAFVEHSDEGEHLLLMLMPPPLEAVEHAGFPTETLFVVDVSGSMAGPAIEAARRALLGALDRLQPFDRFNILRFNDRVAHLAPDFLPVEAASLDRARSWVQDLEADGGTEITQALRAAIAAFRTRDPELVQRIVFLTDGAVDNETKLMALLAARLDGVRLHAIGLGSAPNRHLLERLAEIGRGLCAWVIDPDDAEVRVDRFFARLARPVLGDLDLRWMGEEPLEVYPPFLPELHAGQPLVVSAWFADGFGGAELHARAPRGEVRIAVSEWASGQGLATRWARAKVAALTQEMALGGDPEGLREAIVETGLAYHLVTPYTSLVAIEELVRSDPPSVTLPVPNALPQSSQLHPGVLPQGGTSAPLKLRLGFLLLGLGGICAGATRGRRAA